MAREERTWGYNESPGVFLLHPGNRAAKLTGISRLKKIEPYAKRPARRLRFSEKNLGKRVGWVSQDGHPCDLREGLLEQLDPLSAEPLSYRQCYPGDIAARPSEAADEVIPKGVRHCRKDDRDRDPRIFRRQSTGRPADNHDVYFEPNQFGYEVGEAFGRSFCPSSLNRDVLALNIA